MADIEQTIDAGDPDKRRRDVAYFKALKLAHQEFMSTVGEKLIDPIDPFLFAEWTSITYGFEPHTDNMGYLKPEWTVTDPAKYSFYLLKYSK